MINHKASVGNLKSIDYDSEQHTLTIAFSSGEMYQHYGVPVSIYNHLTTATVPGYFLHYYIRNTYPYKKISIFTNSIPS
ncbi:KTSC domain-containing protein [Lutibacter sp. B2]|nr:KTSC domain-containing protein [Lutibacter sp. B2]